VSQAPALEWPPADLEAVAACPVCGSARREILYDGLSDRVWFCGGGGWSLRRCLECSAAFLDPRPDRESIGRAYASYYTHSEEAPEPEPAAAHARASLRNGYVNARYGYDFTPASRVGPLLARLFPKKRSFADRSVRNLPRPVAGRLLDVGCGQGTFLEEMRQAGWEVEGVEPDPSAAALARANNIPVLEASFEDAPLRAGSYDAVTMNHVIEHFHEPVEALRIARQLLRPGGILWIATPNLASRGHGVFGRDWIGLDPPRHLVLFDRTSLSRAVRQADLEVVGFGSDYSAQLYFPGSATIASGGNPQEDDEVALHRNRLSILLADLVARVAPERAENVVLISRPRSDQ
jgi:2-polyprenyl-3-methyl-5-hydroxy-6-metoxy-1,4-benzoquinol methylase